MQLLQKLSLFAVQCVLWCLCLDIALAMTQSSSYCFTNTSSCRAGGFPSLLFPKLSVRLSPLQFIKSNRRPHIGLGWLQYANYAIPVLHLHCRRNYGYSSSSGPKGGISEKNSHCKTVQMVALCQKLHFGTSTSFHSGCIMQFCGASPQKSHTVLCVVCCWGGWEN